MPAQCLNGILRARWTKAATRSARQYFQRGKRDLINSDQSDEKIFHNKAGVSLKTSGRGRGFLLEEKSGAAADLHKLQAHLGIAEPGTGGLGNPNRSQSGGKVILSQPVNFSKPSLDTIPHHGFAAAFGNDECSFPKGFSFQVPVTTEDLSAQTLSLNLELRKLCSLAHNRGPGELKLRYGVQTGGWYFSGSDGCGLWRGDEQ
jgi:hypothetical protein